VKKSREHLAARQRQIEEQLDRTWQPQRAEPVLGTGNIHYEVSGRIEGSTCGGLGMIQAVVESSGLRQAIDRNLHVLKRHLPYHESDHVLSQVYNLLTGGTCLEDLATLRRDKAFLDGIGARRIPDSTTAGDFLRRFSDQADVTSLMTAINQARSSVWRAQPKSERELAVIDVDGTQVGTHGECKEGMDIDYKGRWGFMPLVVSLANSQEPLFLVNRSGNRPSHEGAAPWLSEAARWARDGAGFQRVRFRGDTDFALTTNFDRWTEDGIEFVFGMDAHPSFVQWAKDLDEDQWAPLERPEPKVQRKRPEKVKRTVVREREFRDFTLDEEHVAEIDYTPSKAKGTYRLILLRKRIRIMKGQLRLEDDVRYFFYVTNLGSKDMPPTAVVRDSNARCHQENLIEQLKNGVQAMRLPVKEFHGNWAYMVIASLAWSLKAWSGLLLPSSLGARSLLKMEFRRFLNELMKLPVQILTTGRRLVFRLLGVNQWTELLLEGTNTLKRRCVG